MTGSYQVTGTGGTGTDASFPFPISSPVNSPTITIDGTSTLITVTEPGVYRIDFQIYTNAAALYINDNLEYSNIQGRPGGTIVSGSNIVKLSDGDTISVRNILGYPANIFGDSGVPGINVVTTSILITRLGP